MTASGCSYAAGLPLTGAACCAVYSRWFELVSGVLILFNIIIMGLYTYSMPRTSRRLQRTGELVLAFVFLAEAILRFVAAGTG